MDYLPEPPNDNLFNHLMLSHAYVREALVGNDHLREIHDMGHAKTQHHLAHTHQRPTPEYIPAPTFDRVPEHLVDHHGYSNLGVLKKLHPDDIGEEHRQLHEEEGAHLPKHTHMSSDIYAQAQEVDPWPGDSYEGTSPLRHGAGTVMSPAPHRDPVCCASFQAMRFCPWCGSQLETQ